MLTGLIDFLLWVLLLVRRTLGLGMKNAWQGMLWLLSGMHGWIKSRDGLAFLCILALILLLAAMVWMGGWRQHTPVTANSDSQEKMLETLDPIVAQIDDANLRLSEVREFAVQSGHLAPQETLSLEDAFKRQLVDDAIEQRLIFDQAQREKIALEPDVRMKLRIARGRILSAAYLEREVQKQVTDEAVRAFYQRQKESLNFGFEYVLEVLRVDDEAAAETLAGYIKGGISFERASVSLPQSVDYMPAFDFIPEEASDPAMKAAAETTPVGSVSAPFRSADGWRIIRVKQKKALAPPSFGQVEASIRSFMTLNAIEKTVDSLKADVTIKTFQPEKEFVNQKE